MLHMVCAFLFTNQLWYNFLGFIYTNEICVHNSKTAIRIILYGSKEGSSVGIATDYGLDGPGSNPGGDEIFGPSGPALGPTQPPVQWVPGLSQG